MKKISLQDLIQTEMEPLSRDQLKNVMGGTVGAVTTTTTNRPMPCTYKCTCENGLYANIDCQGMTTQQIVDTCIRMCNVPPM